MIKLFKGSTEYTAELARALDSVIQIAISSGSSTIEVRSLKPLKRLFFDVLSNHTGSALTVNYWNGSAFAAVATQSDDTNILKRSGFVTWENPSALALDSGLYRYQFAITGSNTATLNIRFIGIVFSELSDIRGEFPKALEFKPAGDTSLIRFQISAKNDIVQAMRNRGKTVYFEGVPRDLTEFDFHEPEQFRMAATYLALSKLFFNASDAPDDKYYQFHKDFQGKYGDAIQLFFASLDLDGDGKQDETTKDFQISTGVMVRA